MAKDSQHSFEARIGRFKNGVEVLRLKPDYTPGNPLLPIKALDMFILEVEANNKLVTNTKLPLDKAREKRKPLVFFDGELKNNECLQKRLDEIAAYLKGELGKKNSSFRNITSIIRKMRPTYEKKDPTLPRGSGNSPMEKSFTSAVGQGLTVIEIISNLGSTSAPAPGFAYNPPNANISIKAMTELVMQISELNKEVARTLDPYGTANRLRKESYDGEMGMSKRITSIKSYLASFMGGKKHTYFIEFSQAIEGN